MADHLRMEVQRTSGMLSTVKLPRPGKLATTPARPVPPGRELRRDLTLESRSSATPQDELARIAFDSRALSSRRRRLVKLRQFREVNGMPSCDHLSRFRPYQAKHPGKKPCRGPRTHLLGHFDAMFGDRNAAMLLATVWNNNREIST